MLPNQEIETKWTSNYKKYYQDKGYVYTKMHDTFMVNIYDLPYGSSKKVKVLCDYCGKDYYKIYHHYNDSHKFSSKDACDNCKHIKSLESRRENTIDKVWKNLETTCTKLDYKLITKKDEFTSQKMNILYTCPKHGIQSNIFVNLINGCGCYKCGRESSSNKHTYKIDEVIEIIESINNNKLLNPFDYTKSTVKNLKVLCSCGNTFIVSLNNYKNGTNRCRNCSRSISKNEKRIYDFLTDNKIDFVYEKTFKDCKDKKVLPFDFYLPLYNLCIEFDGEQHFNDHFFKTIKPSSYVTLEYTQCHDKIKTEYCEKNNINLLRIPYWEENHIEEIITNKLKELDKEKILDKRYSLVS